MTDEAKASRLPLAFAIGLAVGAIALSGYAYAARVPAGQTSAYLAPAASMLFRSLIGVCVAAAAIAVLAMRAAAGRRAAGHSSILAAGTAAVAAYGFIGVAPNTHALLISGPGARPVVVAAQTSWVLLACAALVVLAAATGGGSANPPRRAGIAALACAGVVVAVVVGLAVTSLSSVGTSSATTAPRIPIPAIPTTVGTNVAYTLDLKTTVILPAGPGFVATTDRTVVGYDGTTGAPRWRFPLSDLPARCDYQAIHSTADVVVVECTRPPNDSAPNARYGTDNPAFLVGLDATTGERLWVNDGNWRLQGRLSVQGQAFAAVSADQLAALDPHTGKPLWTRERTDRRECRAVFDTIGTKVVFVGECESTVHLYGADSDTVLDLSKLPGYPSDGSGPTVPAIDHDVVVVDVTSDHGDGRLITAIDTKTMSSQPISVEYPDPAVPRFDAALIPGPVFEIRNDYRTHIVTLVVTAEHRLVDVTGLDMYSNFEAYRWARVGDQFVTNSAYQGKFDRKLATVPLGGGAATVRPNPCGDPGGVIPVPGAVLALCAHYTSQGGVTGYNVVGLR